MSLVSLLLAFSSACGVGEELAMLLLSLPGRNEPPLHPTQRQSLRSAAGIICREDFNKNREKGWERMEGNI